MLIDVKQLKKSEERAEHIGIEKAEAAVIDSIRKAEEAVPVNDVRPTELLRSTRSSLLKGNFVATAPIGDDGEAADALKTPISSPPETHKKDSISDRELERMLDGDDLVTESFLLRALVAAAPICRISVRNAAEREFGCATGFMVSPELLLTNWHVFKKIEWAEKSVAEFNFTIDINGDPTPTYRFRLDPHRFFISDENLDYALVAVNPLSSDKATEISRFGYHRLVPSPGKIEERDWITIIQHPGGNYRHYAVRDNLVIHRKEEDNFLWYKSDTAQGSSGAPAFNDGFQIVALHHLGRALKKNGKYVLKNKELVDSLENIDDSKVVWQANEGLRVSVLYAAIERQLKNRNDEIVKQLFDAIGGTGGIMDNNGNDKGLITVDSQETKYKSGTAASTNPPQPATGFVTINVPTNLDRPMHLAVGFGDTQMPQQKVVETVHKETSAETRSSAEEEAKVVPFIDNDYSNRKGYNENFLGIAVPLPTIKNQNLVSKMDNGKYVIPYEHFSIVVNKNRRLAYFTASNIDGAKKARRPVEGMNYSRKPLGGLAKNDQEKWLTDPRIPEIHQLPDKFYDKDRQSFDKGHIVRREDVCWGDTYEQVKKANGDTYHTTNCSPQVKIFNQSKYEGEWGKLENYILDQAKETTEKMGEKYCVFAGPVFDENDDWFEGFDNRGRIRVQIPRKFWKIVIAQRGEKLESFAFLLEQDLRPVVFEEEFQVTEEWRNRTIKIQELEDMLENITFPKVIKDTDKFTDVN